MSRDARLTSDKLLDLLTVALIASVTGDDEIGGGVVQLGEGLDKLFDALVGTHLTKIEVDEGFGGEVQLGASGGAVDVIRVGLEVAAVGDDVNFVARRALGDDSGDAGFVVDVDGVGVGEEPDVGEGVKRRMPPFVFGEVVDGVDQTSAATLRQAQLGAETTPGPVRALA